MITSNTTFSTAVVHYYIVQHTPDPFRRESRNVGVVVERNGEYCARFFGEKPDDSLDGRTTRVFEYPDIYAQWVRYWRRALNREPSRVHSDLVKSNGYHYNVIEGGELTGSEGDSLSEVCHYAYSMLVSDGGLREALRRSPDEEQVTVNLKDEVGSEFRQLEILGRERSLLLRNPVLSDQTFLGSTSTHTFAFIQEYSGWDVMEPVNLVTQHKNAAKDHAGWAAYAFADIKREHGDRVRPIAIVRYNPDDDDPVTAYALSILHKEARVIAWMDAKQRGLFLEERRAVAMAA